MREAWSRAARVPAPVKQVRRSLKFGCGRGSLRQGISRIARSYGLVDENGSPHDSEVVRLLLVTRLTQGMQNRLALAVNYAVAIQRPMLASALGRRITKRYSTAESHEQTMTRGGRQSCERRNQARVVLDNWLHDALEALAPYWQDDLGRVHDGKMLADLAAEGLQDPELNDIVYWYVQRTSALRQRLSQAEVWINQAVDAAMSEGLEPERAAV